MKSKKLLWVLFIAFLSFYVCYAQLNPVAYADGNQKLNGLSGIPVKPNNKKAGVLILPAWMGIDNNSKNTATELTKLGYHTFIADIFGEGNYPTDMKSAAEQSGYYKSNVDKYHKRIELALQQLIKSGANPADIAIIGYCFGGTGALEAARANFAVKGVVSFHGGLARDTTKAITPIKTKVLVCYGANDFFVPETQVKAFQDEMRKAQADWEMIYYANAVHAFTDKDAGNDPSKGVAYNEKAAHRSWQHMLDFFNELFE